MGATIPTNYVADRLWTAQGWTLDAGLAVDDRGYLVSASAGAAERLGHWVLPGMPNLHSHAFQRAMAGLAERKGKSDDSFWTLARDHVRVRRGALARTSSRPSPRSSTWKCSRAGYTQVCEFHYLHHQPDGTPYAQPEAMSLALIEAAREAGIALTLLPVLYMSGGFDGRPLTSRQRRFGHDVTVLFAPAGSIASP